MTDLLFLAILITFFAVAVLLVRACERIIGPDLRAETSRDQPAESGPDRSAA